MGIGKKLESILQEQGLSPNALSEISKVPATTIYSMINRDSTKADIDTLIRICKALDVSPEVFYSEYAQEKKSSPPSSNLGREQLREIFEKLNNDELKKLLDYSRYLLWLRSQEDN